MAHDSLSPLHALARHLGIQPGYIEQNGTPRVTSDGARRALLTALGYDVATARAARATWEATRATPATLLAPTYVGQPGALRYQVDAPQPLRGRPWHCTLTLEDGTQIECNGQRLPARGLPLPQKLPWGYHHLRLELGDTRAEQTLIVTPSRCLTPVEVLGRGQQASGIWANLYTVHNARSWGVGDLGCLRQLITWAAGQGAQFLGINPLHALRNRDGDISPYSPTSRVYRNALYIDVEAIDELQHSPAAQAAVATHRRAIEAVRRRTQIDYAAVMQLKDAVLKPLYATFVQRHGSGTTARGAAYRAFCAAQGQTLEAFAVFCALDQHFTAKGRRGGWLDWPKNYQAPHLPAVKEFAARNAPAIGLQRYIQFELDNQLRHAATAAKKGGMALGLYQDLAIGTALGGAEPWLFPKLFVPGVSVGAPPDAYAPLGQDWGLPPIDPQQLAVTGYAYWRQLLQSAFAHSGALRIDHILGMFRLYWIPRGAPAKLGGYMTYPHDDLLGIVALESHRHGAVVIGEDLGTVPREVPKVLQKWGMLSSQVMYFEQTRAGAFRAAARYSPHALVTATTHDHIPIAGYIAARDCTLRRQVGHIRSVRAFKQALMHRARELQALERRLRLEGCLPRRKGPLLPNSLIAAAHQFLRKTPAPLIGISLDDIAGETEPVNIPGVGPGSYACWTRRLGMSLEDLAHSGEALARWHGRQPGAPV